MKNHAYSVLKLFKLYVDGNPLNGVKAYMYIVADPFGPWMDTNWNRDYSWSDKTNWNAGTIN